MREQGKKNEVVYKENDKMTTTRSQKSQFHHKLCMTRHCV